MATLSMSVVAAVAAMVEEAAAVDVTVDYSGGYSISSTMVRVAVVVVTAAVVG
jgi:hypothetical protein